MLNGWLVTIAQVHLVTITCKSAYSSAPYLLAIIFCIWKYSMYHVIDHSGWTNIIPAFLQQGKILCELDVKYWYWYKVLMLYYIISKARHTNHKGVMWKCLSFIMQFHNECAHWKGTKYCILDLIFAERNYKHVQTYVITYYKITHTMEQCKKNRPFSANKTSLWK